MMTLNKAKRLAMDGLTRLTGRPPTDLLLIDERTMCRRLGWIFFYESRAHVGSGALTQPATMGPVVVTHVGAVHHLDSERPIDEALRELEKIVLRLPMPQGSSPAVRRGGT